MPLYFWMHETETSLMTRGATIVVRNFAFFVLFEYTQIAEIFLHENSDLLSVEFSTYLFYLKAIIEDTF